MAEKAFRQASESERLAQAERDIRELSGRLERAEGDLYSLRLWQEMDQLGEVFGPDCDCEECVEDAEIPGRPSLWEWDGSEWRKTTKRGALYWHRKHDEARVRELKLTYALGEAQARLAKIREMADID